MSGKQSKLVTFINRKNRIISQLEETYKEHLVHSERIFILKWNKITTGFLNSKVMEQTNLVKALVQ